MKSKLLEVQYLEAMKDILENGDEVMDRTGTGTKKLFGLQLVHDFSDGFPLLSTKKMHTKSIIGELLWFLQGTEDAQFLIDNKITIWDEWIKEEEEIKTVEPITFGASQFPMQVLAKTGRKILPHTYGVQWRKFGQRVGFGKFDGVDQIAKVIGSIRKNPNSRRHIVSAWDSEVVEKAALPWCHVMFQFNCRPNDVLDICVYQRSADWFLGVPFNLASYGFLLSMVAQQTGRQPGRMIYNFGDCHVYLNHKDACLEQLSRYNEYDTRNISSLPCLSLKDAPSIDDYTFGHFSIVGYNPMSAIKAPVSV